MAHEEELLGKAYDSRLMKRLVAYLRPYKWKVVTAIIATILISALGPLRPWLIKEMIDDYIVTKDYQGFYMMIGILVSTVVFHAFVQYWQTILTQWIGQKTIYTIRKEIFSKLSALSMRYFDKNPIGRIVTRLTSDVEALNELFSSGIVMIFADVFVIVWIIAFMFNIDAELSLVVLTVLPFLLYGTALFRKKARESYREVRVLVARMNAFLNERVSGMITVQLFGQEKRTFGEFDKINRAHADANIKSVFYYAVFFPSVEFFSAVAFGLIVWYGGSAVIGKPLDTATGITTGTLIAFIMYTEMFFRPLRDLADKYNILQASMAASERVFMLLDDNTIVSKPDEPERIHRIHGAIEFKNVSFAYNDDDYVLKNISFKVEPGETVAFVGATGAGKSSITYLITRFYEFQKGEILIDGRDIRSLDPRDLRTHVAIVLQDVFLFSANVLTNITLGSEHISAEQAKQAAVTTGADRFINRLPKGYETNVKERGAILSVGEKQLLSFSRALAYDPAILILDEATSSIDTESEIMIQQAIEKLLENRTSIVIAHRLSTIKKADKIIVMHKGEIREIGSHDELLQMNGIYRTLYELQYKEQEIEG
jgi:ATP-binding cassette, subfamily B, multidrug efflux pump